MLSFFFFVYHIQMKIAITGYRGFIGSALMKEFFHRGITAVGVAPTDIGDFDRVYHLACSATPEKIYGDPIGTMNSIIDVTRQALNICPTALFINASSQGAAYPYEKTPMGAYNVAKLCMETYLSYINQPTMSYRLPAVYGPGMNRKFFIPQCIDGTAYHPIEDREYRIAHIADVVEDLADLNQVRCRNTTLIETYNKFTHGEWNLDTRFDK